MAISKTRNMLIDVARQLFARLGVENTTMNDIALASHKGRRTLYTYFNNKNEVYKAVVETELDKMIESLQNVANKDLPADEKLILFFYTRLDAVKKVVARNGTLRADFFRDIWRVQSVRKAFDKKETEILKLILQEGVDQETFSVPDVDLTADILHHALRGLELPYIRGLLNPKDSDNKRRFLNISHLLFEGIKKRKTIY